MEGKFDRHRGAKIWKVVLLCVMWAICCEHDNKAFEGVEHPVTKQYCAEMFV